MKRFVCLICGCWLLVSAFAQKSSLAIATDKTTSLIFPFPIRHVDRGTKDILVQQVKEADNILLVKAASEKFSETNLSVVTEDGSVYTFRVNYAADPSVWIWHVPVQNEITLATYCNGILDNKQTMHGIKDHSWDILSKVIGIYVKSSIDYDIELLKFYIRDKRKGKRTAVQENELTPLYIAGNTSVVRANASNVVVVALDKFTIPDAKYLAIQIMERNGGRHLLMRVHNNKIVKAVPLPDLR
jgi:hypothetical protein